MTLRALGGPPRSQSKCQSSRAPSLSHSKEECPCTGDGKAGWVPTVFHSPTRTSKCLSELVGCGGRPACSFICLLLVSTRRAHSCNIRSEQKYQWRHALE